MSETICKWCGRAIVPGDPGEYPWVDPEATGDDSMWRETCDSHDTFTAEHEPVSDPVLEAYANPVDGDGLGGDAR